MEKILLAVDALKPNRNALDFASYLGRLTKSGITCIFPDHPETTVPVHRDLHGFPIAFAENKAAKNQIAIKARIEETISGFKKQYGDSDTIFVVHRESGLPEEDLVLESRFADMLILNAEMTFDNRLEGAPTHFVINMLKKAECPVIIAPESFEGIDEIIFCYDGAYDSIFAIKQFTYLFPQLQNKKLTVLQIDEDGKGKKHEETRFSEWLKSHYNNFQYEIINGKVKHMLFDFLFKRKDIFIVMGAYGRTALSTFFKKSTAEPLIKTITQPVFISHF